MKNNYGEPETIRKDSPEKSEDPPSCFNRDDPKKSCIHYNRPGCKSESMRNCNRRVWERRQDYEIRKAEKHKKETLEDIL